MSEKPPPSPPPSAPSPAAPDFLVRASFDEAELVGTRWWNESFRAGAAAALFGRRQLLQGAGKPGFAVVLALLGIGGGVAIKTCADDDDDDGIDLDALQLQRREGWDVGWNAATLEFQRPVQMDVRQDTVYAQHLGTLAQVLAPGDARLAPYYVPTLFQSLLPDSAFRLRAAMYPVYTEEMQRSHDRGAALADLARQPGAPNDVALVLDLPGPQSVALAAALAERFAPVFIFDNWPHPKSVVPAHETLGAAIYYRPLFVEASGRRAADAPPAFVLDANRLAPYRDESDRFDNRYLVNLPSASQLHALGIRRLLYVRPDGQSLRELDDLNADFVALDGGGVEVRAVALDDFQQATLADGRRAVSGGVPTYYYGGHLYHHLYFWNTYRWAPAPAARLLPPGRAPLVPSAISDRAPYRPTPRPTIFNTRAVGGLAGVGKQKPSGFGRVSYRAAGGRTSGSTGSRRSGSFGRSRSSSYG
jgi:hypothetical protein